MPAEKSTTVMTPLFAPMWSRPSTPPLVEMAQLEPQDGAGVRNSSKASASASEEETSDQNSVHNSEENEPEAARHVHLLKSGPLGRCDDPFCTTCPPLYDHSMIFATGDTAVKKKRRWYSLTEMKAAVVSFFKWRPGIYNPHTKVVQRWNQVFAVCCLIAVFVDPIFFFIFSARQGQFCLVFNQRFAIAVTIVRSVFDGVYFIHMILQFRLAYIAPSSRTSRTGELIDDPKTIALHYLKGWFIVDLVAVLPLPQVLLWAALRRLTKATGHANYVKNLLRVVVLLQYLPRMLRFMPLLFGRSQSGFIFETAWANFTINLFIYLLAGHVVGSCWYLFGLQRVNQCLQNTCKSESICQNSYLDCGNGDNAENDILNDPQRLNWTLTSNASNNCFVQPTFAYGIYQVAVPVAMDDSPLHKYIYSLFWGFLQISTLGGNLTPSLFEGEILFTFAVIGMGLLLFALLIGNMQNFLQSLGRRQLDMQLQRKDMEAWMRRRHLSPDVQRRVRQAVRLKWSSTRGVNEEALLDRLPEDLQKEIRRFLCLELVKKVHIFTVMHEEVLDAICERLHEVLYVEGSEIFHADTSLHRMMFIVRGTLSSVGKDQHEHMLVSGDFCGEELLIWCLEHEIQASGSARSNLMKKIGNRAVSTRTVRCLSSVEAFSLEEKDLEYVVKHYTRYMRNPRVQGAIRYESAYFRTLAAERIQAAWKSYRRKKFEHSHTGRRMSSRELINWW